MFFYKNINKLYDTISDFTLYYKNNMGHFLSDI